MSMTSPESLSSSSSTVPSSSSSSSSSLPKSNSSKSRTRRRRRGALFTKPFKLSSSIFVIIILLIQYNIPNIFSQIIANRPMNLDEILYNKPSLVNVSLPESLLSDQADLSAFYVDNENIFVFGKNVLYHVESTINSSHLAEFNLLRQIDIKPSDTDGCVEANTDHACSCSTDNIVKSVFVLNDLLVACGSRSQGKCIIFKKSDISVNRPYFDTVNTSTSDVIASSRSSIIFPGNINGKSMFYVGFEYDCERRIGKDSEEMLATVPFISARSMGRRSLTYSIQDQNFVSKLDLHYNHRNRTKTKFIYGFDDDHYAYFITVQKNHNILETRIGRVCHDNLLFNAYTEIVLKCDKHTVARSATHFKHHSHGKSVIVSFDSENHNSSSVCFFSLTKIEETFVDATRNCFESGSHSKLLPAFYDDSPSCENIDFGNIDKYLCKRTTNQFILGEIPIEKKSFFSIENDRITSLSAVNDPMSERNKPFILLITTLKSNLLRLDVQQAIGNNFSVAVNFIRQFSIHTGLVPVNPIYDSKAESFFILTGSSIVQVPITTCSIYTSCTNCNQPNKNCLWYKSRCFNKDDVPNNDRELMCPPEIYSYSPASGPLEGGTLITFHGLNFGISDLFHQNSDDNNAKISIGGTRMCDVVKRNNTMIQCKVNEVIPDNFQSYFAPVVMEIKYLIDVNRLGYFIDGKVTAPERFNFKNPEVRGIFPSYGPFAGGTKVMVYGTNLNIGSNLTVMFGDFLCEPKSRSESYALCSTTRFLTTQPNVEPKQINIQLDSKRIILNDERLTTVRHNGRPNKYCTLNADHNDTLFCKLINRFLAGATELMLGESFQYLPNPSVQKTDNLNTIAFGETVMRFYGDSLGSSALPMIVISLGDTPVLPLACNATVNQTQLECPFPSSSDPFYGERVRQLVGKPLVYKLWFDSHSVTYASSLNVYANPVFDKFNKTQIGSLQKPQVDFSGEYLNPLPYDIVLISSKKDIIPCRPTSALKTTLTCKAIADDTTMSRIEGSDLEIVIRIGRAFEARPGFVRFESNKLGFGAIFGIIFSVITFIVTFGFLLYIYYKFRQQDPEPPHELETLMWKENLQKIFDGYGFATLFDELNNNDRIINPHRMKVDENNVAGNGNFGIVYRASYRMCDDIFVDAALKVQREKIGESFAAFIYEVDIMKVFNHPNVMNFYGITLYSKKPGILLPYMDGKDLKNYITQNELRIRDLLDFGIQIASGMTYISELGRVHRDLALRNCMLKIGPPSVVKVADFGLTREFSNSEYYTTKTMNALPVKWMSPESLKTGKFTAKSDVYSYGVTLWELMTRGNIPWEYIDGNNMLEELERGRRLPRPEYCPDLIFLIMCKCWWPNPDDRPTFRQLYEELVETVEMLKNLENTQLHSYQNSYFRRFNSNPSQIFDYNDPQTFDLIHNARNEILQSKIGIVFDPSAEFENESESPYQSINEEPPTYSAATGTDYQPINNGFHSHVGTSKASAPPLSFNP